MADGEHKDGCVIDHVEGDGAECMTRAEVREEQQLARWEQEVDDRWCRGR